LQQTDIYTDDIYLFNTGQARKAYLTFGCHAVESDKHRFCVWAPNALKVSVVGDFNGWDDSKNVMQRMEGGVYVAFVDGLKDGDNYKYCILDRDHKKRFKADPFAFHAEVRPATASKVWDIGGYEWRDAAYMARRRHKKPFGSPMSIYEMHIGSWRKKEGYRFASMREVADELLPYLKKMGFTHVEVMPIVQYPYDGSWGYQITGYYAINSCYGTPQDFKYFVDRMHEGGIGVIVDWVGAHFPKDEHGLARFDGTCLFEHENPVQGEHPQWGTLIFNYGRPEVVSFLISNAVFFMDEFHVDGLRMDAVSSMIYLDYGREKGAYIPNKYGSNLNLEAIELVKQLNSIVLSEYPGTMTIAEESTSYPLVTRPPYDGGLGFSFKWNLGFMNDTLDYMSLDPLFRKDHHQKMTFSMYYAFSENFILPYSHDEVVHGKKSMVDKMPGDYWQKFASLRALYGFMFAHPGKKLLFMGDEFAQFIEWDYKKELDWFLLEYELHGKMQLYVERLNKLYRSSRALYEIDDNWDGFSWLKVDDAAQSVLIFMRSSKEGPHKRKRMVCAFNFTPVPRVNYVFGLPFKGILKECMNSDSSRFGGSGVDNEKEIQVFGEPLNQFEYRAQIALPPLSAVYFDYVIDENTNKRERVEDV